MGAWLGWAGGWAKALPTGRYLDKVDEREQAEEGQTGVVEAQDGMRDPAAQGGGGSACIILDAGGLAGKMTPRKFHIRPQSFVL